MHCVAHLTLKLGCTRVTSIGITHGINPASTNFHWPWVHLAPLSFLPVLTWAHRGRVGESDPLECIVGSYPTMYKISTWKNAKAWQQKGIYSSPWSLQCSGGCALGSQEVQQMTALTIAEFVQRKQAALTCVRTGQKKKNKKRLSSTCKVSISWSQFSTKNWLEELWNQH